MIPDLSDAVDAWERNQLSADRAEEVAAEFAATQADNFRSALLRDPRIGIYDPAPSQWKDGWTAPRQVQDYLSGSGKCDEDMHVAMRILARVAAGVADDTDKANAEAILDRAADEYQQSCFDRKMDQ